MSSTSLLLFLVVAASLSVAWTKPQALSQDRPPPLPLIHVANNEGSEVDREKLRKALIETPFRLSRPMELFAKEVFLNAAKDDDGDVILSPFSLHTALSMLYFGSPADSATHDEMARVLELMPNHDYVTNYLQLLSRYDAVRTHLSDTTVEFANKIFLRGGFTPKSDYAALMRIYYVTDVENLVSGDTRAGAKQVNDFISRKTHGLIEDVIDESAITNARMILVNAIYFKANWKYTFPKDQTVARTFTVSEGQSFQHARTMRQHGNFVTGDLSPEIPARALVLPYEDDNFRMVVILPNEGVDVREVEASMGSSDLSSLLERRLRQSAEVSVQLPRFKVSKGTDMVKILMSMGVTTLFDENTADLSDLSDESDLAVTTIAHDASIEVTEEGSEAAAATVAVVGLRTSSVGPFVVNRPFLFVLQDVKMQIPLFMGRVVDPSGQHRKLPRRSVVGEFNLPARVDEERALPDCPENDSDGYQVVNEPNISFPCKGRDTRVVEESQRRTVERMDPTQNKWVRQSMLG